ncbi:MAG: bifunctional riboflavin kinase/FAD synthetase [Lachnospiraceae bacterium]|nr:bifunctional riboflavin kinase/FAD synthetase [Lachnospiraceae bacterium]
MKFYEDLNDVEITAPCAISLGKFDGLHIGHKLLMSELNKAKESGLLAVAVTFSIPPNALDGEDFRVLTTKPEKLWIFEQAGIDVLIELPFTKELRAMEPEAFLAMVTEKIPVKEIVAGTDFRFGKNRSGDYKTLLENEERFGYRAVIFEKVQDDGMDISSTRIREAVKEGNLAEANRLLGYDYFLSGKVVVGNQLGRTIQVPTANLLVPKEKLLPPNGGYVTHLTVDGKVYGGISNIGYKPTVGENEPFSVETHIFDFNEDIYGKQIWVSFLEYLRPEKKYDSLDALKKQIDLDIKTSREILARIEKQRI